MKNLILLFTLVINISFLSCNSNKDNISFMEASGEAILIGDTISLLDSELNTLHQLKEGSLVQITNISDSLIKKTKDYCDDFNFVKIIKGDKTGIIDGRKVYKISPSQQDTFFDFKATKYTLITTKFFGIGVANDDGLTFCDKYFEPIVIKSEKTGEIKLIELIKNNYTEEAYWNHTFKYFELMANDGAYDKIESISETPKGVILKIKREFQEGWNHFEVSLIISKQNFQAEVINYGAVQE